MSPHPAETISPGELSQHAMPILSEREEEEEKRKFKPGLPNLPKMNTGVRSQIRSSLIIRTTNGQDIDEQTGRIAETVGSARSYREMCRSLLRRLQSR